MSKRMPIFFSALMLTGVNLLLRTVSTSFQVYLSGRIGAAGIGLLQLVLSVGALAMTAGMAGVRTSTMYLTAEELGRRRPGNITWILSGCARYSIICSMAVGLLLYAGASFLAENWIGDARVTGAIRLYAGFIPIYCLCGVMTGYFTAANRIGTLAAVEVGEQLLCMGATLLLLIFWAKDDPVRSCCCVILGSGCSGIMTLLVLLWLRVREGNATGGPIPVTKRLLGIAVPLALADDLKAGISTAENLMVPKRLRLYPGETDALASFGMVCGMVFPVMMFPAAILFGLAELLIPELARCAAAGSASRIRYLTKQSLRLSMLYGCVIAGGIFLMADPLCLRLYKNPSAGTWLRVYALLIPMLYCDAITDAMTKGLGQQKACVRYNIITSAMDVALLFILLPKYGMPGYFASFLVTHVLNFALSLRRLLKTAKGNISLRAPLLTLAATALAVALSSLLQGGVVMIVYLLSVGSLLTLFHVIGKEDIAWIRGLVGKK